MTKQNRITGAGRKVSTKIYRKNCSVCQFMKKKPDFRLRVMQSTYFNPEGHESLAGVIAAFGMPFSLQLAYAHVQRHQPADRERMVKQRLEAEALKAIDRLPNSSKVAGKVQIAAAVESEVVSNTAHERGLDMFIQQGHEMLLRKEMPITATNFLAAIKTKADIEKNTKDRRMDMIKAFFTGGGQKEDGK